MSKITAGAVGLGVFLASSTFAQNTALPFKPEAVTVEFDSGWRLDAVVHNGAVAGFFAQLDAAHADGAEPTMVLLAPDANGHWGAWGWEMARGEEAVAAVREFYGDASVLDGVEFVSLAAELAGMVEETNDGVVTPAVPEPVGIGVLWSLFQGQDPEAALGSAADAISLLFNTGEIPQGPAAFSAWFWGTGGCKTIKGPWSPLICTGSQTSDGITCYYTNCSRSRTQALVCPGVPTTFTTIPQTFPSVTTPADSRGICPSSPPVPGSSDPSGPIGLQ